MKRILCIFLTALFLTGNVFSTALAESTTAFHTEPMIDVGSFHTVALRNEKIFLTEVPIMSAAVKAYRHVAASPEFREMARLRSKARHDEAQALNNARREERVKLQGVIDEQAAIIVELQAQINNK